MGAVRTGKFASEADREEAMRRYREVRATPVIVVGKSDSPDLASLAQEEFLCWVDGLAQRYGFPPPQMRDGLIVHYGMLGSGEFLTWDGV